MSTTANHGASRVAARVAAIDDAARPPEPAVKADERRRQLQLVGRSARSTFGKLRTRAEREAASTTTTSSSPSSTAASGATCIPLP